MALYLKLFYVFFKVGLFSFGGGTAMFTLISQEVVTNNSWITLEQFTKIIAISEVTPGPIAINTATYIGYVATQNIFGAAVATVGVVLPSVIVMMILLKFIEKFKHLPHIERIFKGLKVVVIGLILGATFLLMNKNNLIDYKSYILLAATLVAMLKFKLEPIPIVVGAAIIGVIIY